ncbi:MAG: hypothetical protein KDJ69_08655 [Nitratireductor sp.]|nr:hypothetical protein [Nitratireductor sp.]
MDESRDSTGPLKGQVKDQVEELGRQGLVILAVLQLLMLAALYTRTEPHPPLVIPLFALAPFLSASIALAVAGLLVPGRWLSVAASITALISFGPQKWFDASFPQIWPAVILAQIAVAMVTIALFRDWQERRSAQ